MGKGVVVSGTCQVSKKTGNMSENMTDVVCMCNQHDHHLEE